MKNITQKFTVTAFAAILLFAAIFLSAAGALAHVEGAVAGENNTNSAFDQDALREVNIKVAAAASVILLVLVLFAFTLGENSKNGVKKIIFWSMASVIALPSFFFAGTTLYLNAISITKGPVHWHADFRIFACGREIEPVDVKGLSNKLGTNLLHEHEDRRIHVEGVVIKESDVALDKFFEVQGGELSSNTFSIPTHEGLRTITNGDKCDDGTRGVWQAFLYTTDDTIAEQQKLGDFVHYVLSPHTNVPPGDCIIFEFGPEKGRTDTLCDFYKLEADKGNLKIR